MIFRADLLPAQYNLLSQRRVRRRFGFDIVVVKNDSEDLEQIVAFFQQVRQRPGMKKGNFEDTLMIDTAEQLYQAIEQMGRMQRILESHPNEILTKDHVTLPCSPKARGATPTTQMQIDEYLQTWKMLDASSES